MLSSWFDEPRAITNDWRWHVSCSRMQCGRLSAATGALVGGEP
jgi:hypothetical protein